MIDLFGLEQILKSHNDSDTSPNWRACWLRRATQPANEQDTVHQLADAEAKPEEVQP